MDREESAALLGAVTEIAAVVKRMEDKLEHVDGRLTRVESELVSIRSDLASVKRELKEFRDETRVQLVELADSRTGA